MTNPIRIANKGFCLKVAESLSVGPDCLKRTTCCIFHQRVKPVTEKSMLKSLNLKRRVARDALRFYRKTGTLGLLDFSIHYYQQGGLIDNIHKQMKRNDEREFDQENRFIRISPWHHVPLFQIDSENGTYQIEEENSNLLHSDIVNDKILEGIDEKAVQFWKNLIYGQIMDDCGSSHKDDNSISHRRLSVATSFLSMPNVMMNMVVEIPKFTYMKMEISTEQEGNPIVQDLRNGSPRLYGAPMYWNYGALPQTWENPFIHGGSEVMNSCGDNDPLDVVEVGDTPLTLGQVIPVRVLGSLALVDQGEVDWKILAIRADDPRSEMDVRDVRDVEELFPKVMVGIREWFRWYKLPEGKPLNAFGYDEDWLSPYDSCRVIAEGHTHWLSLLRKKQSGYKDTKLWTPKSNDVETTQNTKDSNNWTDFDMTLSSL